MHAKPGAPWCRLMQAVIGRRTLERRQRSPPAAATDRRIYRITVAVNIPDITAPLLSQTPAPPNPDLRGVVRLDNQTSPNRGLTSVMPATPCGRPSAMAPSNERTEHPVAQRFQPGLLEAAWKHVKRASCAKRWALRGLCLKANH